MTERKPRFSIVVPCYNQGAFIEECLASVRAQTLAPHEVIVVDDGSTDDWTVQRLREVCRPPLVLVRQENRGLSGARNTAVRHATGDWILPLDADDQLTSDALASYAEAIETDPSVDVWFPDIQMFGIENRLWHVPEFNAWRQLTSNGMVCSSAIRRTVFDSGIHYNERMRSGYEDWEFYIHACCEAGFVARHLKRPIFRYRRWGYSMLSSADTQMARLREQIRNERPIYSDETRLLELKRQWSPFFAIAAEGLELSRALAAQGFRDYRVVDETGQVPRDGDFRIFQRGNLGHALLVSVVDAPLAECLSSDPYWLEKTAWVCTSRNPSVLWLVTSENVGAAYPGFLMTEEAERGKVPVGCAGFILSVNHIFDHPDFLRTSAGLLNDLARSVEWHAPGSTLKMIIGSRGGGAPTGSSVSLPTMKSTLESVPASAPVRDRLMHLGKSASQLIKTVVGPERHERFRRTRVFHKVRSLVDPSLPPPPGGTRAVLQPKETRAGPLDATRLSNEPGHRDNAWFIAHEQPRFPDGCSTGGPALLIAVPWLVHGGADRAVLDLLCATTQLAPHLHKYLVTTQPARMEWADQVLPHVNGVFNLGDLDDKAASDFQQKLIRTLGIDALLVVNSVRTLESLPALRQLEKRVRVVAQLHSFMRDPVTGELQGHPVTAASRFNNLIDGYAVISRFLSEQLTNKLYVSPSKIRTIYLGIDVARFAQARRRRLEDRCVRVLWLGRLSAEKDPGMVLRVAKAWLKRHGADRLHITLAGGGDPSSGDLPSQLRAALKADRLDQIVTMVGPMADPLLLYREADCLLMTSRSEGIPVVIYEAMAAELPIITPIKNTAIDEVLSDQEAFFINRQDDPLEYVSALERVVDHPEIVRARAEAAAARCSHYDVTRYAEEMLQFLFPEGIAKVRLAS